MIPSPLVNMAHLMKQLGDEGELEQLLGQKGVEAALNLAENIAVAGGHLDPDRADPRIFFEDDAPLDAFMTNRQRGECSHDVQYSFDYNLFGDGALLSLEAHKVWHEPDGSAGPQFHLVGFA